MTTATQSYNDERCDKDGIEQLGDEIAIGDGYVRVEGKIIVAHVDDELAEQWDVEPDSYLMCGDVDAGEVSDEDFERVSKDVLDAFEADHGAEVDLTEVESGMIRIIGEFVMTFARRMDGDGHYLAKYGYDAHGEAELIEQDR